MKKIFIHIVLLAFILSANAQDISHMKGHEICSQKKMNNPNAPILLGDSPNTPKHKFDVLDYNISVDIRQCFISPYPKNFNGVVTVKFRVDTALTSIDLNAVNTSISVTSVGLSGISFTHTGNILTVTLDRTYNPGEIVYVRIYYSHLNVSDQAFYTGNGGVFTDCEPEGARKWFPCWDKPSDKATVDLVIKVPSTAKIGASGRLQDSLVIGDTTYYHWVSRDPVATYLVVMTGKINYQLNIVYYHKITNPIDSVPIRFYYNSGENPSTIINSVILPMTTYYSQKFGEHAFEKNGFTTAPAPGFTWGGMENQTLTTLCPGCWSENLVSHEYAHQWYGDMITCGTWADIWLNEGFATYAEALWYEKTGGYSSYKSDILSDASTYMSGNTGYPIYRPEWAVTTPPVNELFNTAMTYCKGACVLHMLRYVLNDSNMFFNCMRGYSLDTANFRYKSSVTDDFATKISQVSGQDLVWFIEEWVKQPNHPVYANTYNFTPAGGGNWTVGFIAKQTQTNTPFHKMPIVLRISFTSGPDTNIRVMNDVNNQTFVFTVNRQPNNLVFDPDNDIVLKTASTVLGIVSELEIPRVYALYQNFPNPFNPVTTVKFDIPERAFVKVNVFDVTGKLVSTLVNEERATGKYAVSFDASSLSSGIYYYTIVTDKFTDTKKMVLVK
jgi:aminopeptidase N